MLVEPTMIDWSMGLWRAPGLDEFRCKADKRYKANTELR